MRACWDEVQVLKALCRPSSHDEQPQQQRQQCHGRSSSSRDGCGDVAAPSMPWHRALGDSSDYWGRVGRFNTLIAHVPHPDHQAIVMPILGASLLDVLRRISHAVERVSRNTRPASAIEQGGSPRQGVVVVDVDYNGMPLSLVRPVLYQILLFLQHAHRRGIVHTDLKPENILFESCGRLQKRLNVEQLRYSYAASQSTERWQQQQQQQSTYFRSDSGAHGSYACPPLREVGRSSMVVDVALPMTNSVRVIDLGAAEFLSSCHSVSALDGVTRVFQHRIQTTHYRSVEVLLGLGWAASTDIWSLGCMIPELLTGACVFMPKSDLEHLALMQHIIGAFDSVENVSHGDNGKNSMVRRVFCKGTHFGKYFNTSTMQLAWPPAPIEGRQRRGEVEKEVRYVKSQPTLQEVLGPYPQLHDLCRRMLDYDPRCRITAEEALQHPFFTTPE
ncbi:protein kinase [Trypanosoma grayi]|uniref:protein kinase n=1 Tax=Trypanosoma grayi TaxID=71804 RepID=UPI0004F49117|nr:protein kinase [Trypanosoma grayi]KEG06203.1 protein kinase [Trypanosoma grayi]